MRFLRVGDHRQSQMGQIFINRHFHPFGIDQNQPGLLGRGFKQKAGHQGVHTDASLPEPVEPAIKTCGISFKLAKQDTPEMSLPKATKSFLGEDKKSSWAINSLLSSRGP